MLLPTERGRWCSQGGDPTHLPSTVAALPGQVLPMDQRTGGPAALQGQPRVDERGGARVVVDKESLQKEDIDAFFMHYV